MDPVGIEKPRKSWGTTKTTAARAAQPHAAPFSKFPDRALPATNNRHVIQPIRAVESTTEIHGKPSAPKRASVTKVATHCAAR